MADTLADALSQPEQPVEEQPKKEEPGFFGKLGSALGFGGGTPDPAAPVAPTTPPPEAKAQVAQAVDKDPSVVDKAGKGLLSMTSTLPPDMKMGFNNEYAQLKKDYQEKRDSMAWVEGITMLAQFALKMVAANKSMHEGYDYTSGVHIDPQAFSGAYKSLKDDYDMGMKDIQFRLHGAQTGEEAKREADLRQNAEFSRAGEAAGRLKEETRHNQAMEGIAKLGASQSLSQGMNPKDYANMQMEIDTLSNIGQRIIDHPTEMDGWGWSVYDNPEDVQKLVAMGVKIPKDLTHATPEEKAQMGASLKAAMNKRREQLAPLAPPTTGTPKTVRGQASAPVGVLAPAAAAPPAKPQTVVQNGHTYTLQPDGTYK